MSRLRRSDCHAPGITRRGRGKGFSCYRENGSPVTDAEVLDRIRGLAAPPAWVDVWICPWPHGHIQATGTDTAGRRQYRYHDAWRVLRDRQKFDRVLEFGRAQPALRAKVAHDLASEGTGRNRVLAGAVRLLDLGFLRVGGEQYAEENETFGIATPRKEHVALSKGVMTFDYPTKGSIQRVVTISDPAAFELIQTLRRRRGGSDHLLAYKEGRRWTDAKSDDVNAYIREAADGEYGAKDFRTWSGTVLAALELGVAGSGSPMSKTARRKAARLAVKAVTEYLGTTPAVCRASYIDPKILDRFDGGQSIADTLRSFKSADQVMNHPATRQKIETAVIDLIADTGSSSQADAA
jgi:DNA topoisomerase-1